MLYAFDIETIPNTEMLGRLPEPEVKTGNLKDPDKIAEKIAEAKREQIEKMALNPLYGRIACFVLLNEGNVNRVALPTIDDKGEAELLELLFAALGGTEDVRLATWNGNGFDLPYVYRRALLLEVDPREFSAPSLEHWTKRYSTKPHADLMQIWGGWSSQGFAKLDDVAGALLGARKLEVDFKEFPELLKTEDGKKKLLDYCEQDTRLTLDLFGRFQGILF